METSEKVEHVRTAPSDPSGQHRCHWPGCTAKVKPAHWGCKDHWRRLPRIIMGRIWAEYRPGQEITKKPSPAYVAAARAAEAWVISEGLQIEQGALPL